MKKIFIILILLGLSSCKLIKYTSQQAFSLKSNQVSFFYDNKNQMLLKNTIDSVDAKLIFDTGAGLTIITNEKYSVHKNEKDALKFGSSTLPNGKKISNKFYPIDLNNTLFSYDKYLVAFLPNKENKCYPDAISTDGILGMSFVLELENKILFLDFDHQLIINPNEEKEKLLKENMTLAKTEFFKGRHIKIYLKINGKEIPFLFDTGNSAYELAVTSDFETNLKPRFAYEGGTGKLADGTLQMAEIDTYENVEVALNKTKTKNTLTRVSSLKENNVGINFIKNYNWLIDYENKEVYFIERKNTAPKEKLKERNDYYTYTQDDKLFILFKNKHATKYQINEQIIEVNGETVTEDNICDISKMLNKEGVDWNTMNIKTK